MIWLMQSIIFKNLPELEKRNHLKTGWGLLHFIGFSNFKTLCKWVGPPRQSASWDNNKFSQSNVKLVIVHTSNATYCFSAMSTSIFLESKDRDRGERMLRQLGPFLLLLLCPSLFRAQDLHRSKTIFFLDEGLTPRAKKGCPNKI